MIFQKRLNSAKTACQKWISLLGLTRAEASFILFLALAAFIGAWVPEIRNLFKDGHYDELTPNPAINENFHMNAESAFDDSARIDSLIAFFSHDTNGRAHWEKRSDTLREMFLKRVPQNTINDYISETGDEPVRRVNINTANAQTLTSLPGIGPKMAEKIIAYREQKGPFRSVDELMKVKGVGKKTFAKLKPYIDI